VSAYEEGVVAPVSVHVRLGPETPGNDGSKASWRYAPSGRGTWPLVFGNLLEAEHVFLTEGEWDFLALVDVMGWAERKEWPRVAVVGIRGSTSHGRFLKYPINERAHAYCLADADAAGEKWLEPGGLVEQLEERVARVDAFWPTEQGQDLNDAVKAGLTRDEMLANLMIGEKRTRKVGMTFYKWCQRQVKQGTEHAALAKWVTTDKSRPAGRSSIRAWRRHWEETGISPDLREGLEMMWQDWVSAMESLRKGGPVA